MIPGGRFGQLLAQGVQKTGISLRELADKLDYTYEQMRKIWIGSSSPSPQLLKEISKLLDLDLKAAEEASAADRMERRYGQTGLKVLGQNPRLSGLSAVAAMLTDAELATLVAVAQGLINARYMRIDDPPWAKPGNERLTRNLIVRSKSLRRLNKKVK